MPRSRRDIVHAGPALLARGAALALLLQSFSGALAAQTVVGHVVRAGDEARIAGVSVVLLDGTLTPLRRAVTDTVGAFVLPAGAPGTYRLLVEGEGFASWVTEPVELGDGGYHEERLVLEWMPVPAAAARPTPPAPLSLREDHVVALCGPEFDPARQAVLAGAVVDARTGSTVPGALATAEWSVASRGSAHPPERIEIEVGEEGWFVYCGVPAALPLRVQALGWGRRGRIEVVEAAAGRVASVDLSLWVSGPAPSDEPPPEGRGSVLGRVVDFATGEPVADAEVRVGAAGGRTTVTDENGRFLLEDVPSGSQVLAVRHVAFPDQDLVLPVIGGSGHEVLVQLVSEAVPLAPLRVTVRSTRWFQDMRGFTERARTGVGFFFPPEDVRRRNPSALVDLVRTVPGIRVAMPTDGGPARLTVRGRRCDPTVFVDRTPWSLDDPFTALRGADLEAVEVYRGLTEIPPEFLGRDDDCGAVVVWTRKAQTTPR